MNRIFNVIPIEDYGVVVDRETNKTNHKLFITDSGTIITDNQLPLTYAGCTPIIASIGKRIEGVPLIVESNPSLEKDLYKAAQSKRMYSEKDMRNAVDVGIALTTMTEEPFTSPTFKTLKRAAISGLLNKLPKQVELEMEDVCDYEGEELFDITPNLRLVIHDTTNNIIHPVKLIYE